jgi:hypothetical protein
MASPVPSSLKSVLIGTALSIGFGVGSLATAAAFTWDGGGADDLSGTAGNWTPDGYPLVTGAPGTPAANGMQFATGNLTPILNLGDQTHTFSNTVPQFWIGGATTGTHPDLVKNRTWDAAAGDAAYQAILLRPDGIDTNSTTTVVSEPSATALAALGRLSSRSPFKIQTEIQDP